MKPQSKYAINQIVLWKDTQCEIVAVSPRTGGLTIKLKADIPPHRQSDRVSVMPYDIRPYVAVCATPPTPLPIVLSIAAKYLANFIECERGAHEDQMTGPSPITTLSILSRHQLDHGIRCETFEEAAQVLDCCRYGTFPLHNPRVAARLYDVLYAIPEVKAVYLGYDTQQFVELVNSIKAITSPNA